MKKCICLLLAALSCVALVGCSITANEVPQSAIQPISSPTLTTTPTPVPMPSLDTSASMDEKTEEQYFSCYLEEIKEYETADFSDAFYA